MSAISAFVPPTHKAVQYARASQVTWVGPATVTRTQGRQTRVESTPGGVVKLRLSDLGVPTDLNFQVQVYAKGITDQGAGDPQKAIKDLGLRVETGSSNGKKLMSTASKPLEFDRLAGIDNHDFVVKIQFSDLLGGTRNVQPGNYPMRLMAGSRTLALFMLELS